MTAVKMGPPPADAPAPVGGGTPAEVVVSVEATMVPGGASVTAQAKDILQVRKARGGEAREENRREERTEGGDGSRQF